MVKPPKTMQPEAVADMTKAGRDRQKAFGEDSFHTYLARKIDLQRNQFGVQLPPPPQEQHATSSHHELLLPVKTGATKSVRFHTDGALMIQSKSHKKFGVSTVLKRLQRRHGVTKTAMKRRREDMCIIESLESDAIKDREFTSSSLDDSIVLASDTNSSSEPIFVESITKTKPSTDRPDLFFRGVVVLINGYTHPDGETLQRLLQQHGGDVERYETSRVTHVIAEQLSTAKANLYKKQKRNPTPVCHPSWILDSVAAFRLLPFQEYVIDDVKKDKDVVSVKAFFQRSSDGRSVVDADREHLDSNGLEKGATKSDSSYMMDPSEATLSNNKKETLECDPIMAPNSAIDQSPPKESLSYYSSRKGPVEERLINGRVRTVGTDPNFLETFFSASRLSFIGSYRQRTRPSPTKRIGAHIGSDEVLERFVFHVDMDCFFASVVLRNFPQYRDKPVAISHNGMNQKDSLSDAGSGRRVAHKDSSSECATCNYEARKYGVKKGMFLGQAKALCPDLIVLQYDFDGYEEVSETVSDILHRYVFEHSGHLEQVSCDEAYLEFHFPFQNGQIPSTVAGEIAESIREEIFASTQCTATVGVAANKLLAKLATDHVKPNKSYVMGDYHQILKNIRLRDLYGIGYKMKRRLENENLDSVQDVWDLGDRAQKELCRILGPALGKKVFGYCHGKDDRPIQASERKTIGAECSYGVRFDGPYGVDYMIEGLCKEVEKRMTHVGVKGVKVTLKLKQRKANAPPPPKYLGHGSCHQLSKTGEVKSGSATRHWKCFYEVAIDLYRELKVEQADVRGMGVVISKLVSDAAEHRIEAPQKQSIARWFNDNGLKHDTMKVSRKVEFLLPDTSAEVVDFDGDSTGSDVLWVGSNSGSPKMNKYDDTDDFALPALSQIHMSQVNELPSPLRKKVVLKIENEKNRSTSLPVDPEEFYTGKDFRLRQTDVKRMLRLAAVKSGSAELLNESGQAISLTQLDCLPLDLQLEIANNDSHGLGPLSPEEKMNRKGDFKSKRPFRNLQADSSPTTERICANEGDIDFVPSVASNSLLPTSGTVDYVQDNLRPLTLFLDKHPQVDATAIQKVIDFLCICVAQNRLSDTTRLLCSIQNRTDLWNTQGFDTIFDAVNHQVQKLFRASLDKDWLRKM